MIQYIDYKGAKVRYQDQGTGNAVVLLHGYLESLEIWGKFATELAKNYRVIAIDLLGHGQSQIVDSTSTVEEMANAVKTVLESLNISKCTVFGHSMGGYVTLELLENQSHILNGFGLVHSIPFGDSQEKKLNRDREIELIKQGKKTQIYSAHFPKTFANDNVERFQNEIESAKNAACSMTDEGIIATIKGLKARKNYANVLKNSELPFLYVLGLKDNFIPATILERIEMPAFPNFLILENSGHNGFLEEFDRNLEGVLAFLKKVENV